MNPADSRGTRIGIARGVGVALLCWVLICLLHLSGTFEPSDLNLLDLRYRMRGVQAASDAMAIIEVDDATIEAYGDWPLPRDQYALLISALGDAGAGAIGIDLLFLGNDKYDPRFDQLLALVTEGHDNVVHAITFSPEHARSEEGIGDGHQYTEILETHGTRDTGIRAFDAERVTLPYEDLIRSSKSLGHVLVMVDPDGVVRRVPVFVRYREVLYPCLGLSVTALSQGRRTGPWARAVPGGALIEQEDGGKGFVPIDRDGAARIDFAGERAAFKHIYSMLEVLQWHAAGDSARLAEAFKNRTIVVGATAVGQIATDLGATPFSPATPLLFVHANAVNSFLTGRFLSRPNPVLYLAILGGLSILLGWLIACTRILKALVVIFVCLVGVSGITYVLFLKGIEIPPTAGLALPPLIYAALQSFRFVFVERKVRRRRMELQVASAVQRRLLPTEPPEIQGLDVHGINIPALEVGGDYYDWIVLRDGSLAVAVGDVCGKGIPAALLMAHLEASFHAEVKDGVPGETVLQAMNRSLHRSVEPGHFATFLLAIVPGSGNSLLLCNGGHNPAVLVHDGRVEMSTCRGLALVILEDAEYEEERRPWSKGDILILYSDGVTECTWRDEMYGEVRLRDLVAELSVMTLSAAEIGQAILDDLSSFSHGHLESDDVTLVVVKRI